MHSLVHPNAWVCLRLPSDTLKIIQVVPNTIVSLGKYGTFSSNLIIERPYNLTYELLDRKPGHKDSELRIVSAAELHEDTIAEEEAAKNPNGSDDKITIGGDGVEFQLVGENGEVIMRSNRETIDDSARQTLTMEEIEELKREGTGAGKDLIAKLMASHLGLDQKTAFSLAKYKLLKTKKYLRRFTILPVDVPMLGNWMMEEKDASKILEMRQEMVALLGSWSNVHFSEMPIDVGTGCGRWLVVDETGGLLVASLAERMGILYPDQEDEAVPDNEEETYRRVEPPLATSNTITLIHNNAQPNLALLKYFSYNPTDSSTSPNHPLSTHLHSLSWLQLLSPSNDSVYSTPIEPVSPETLASYRSGKRATYYRKLRRHNRIRTIVDTTLSGSFSGLAIASHMDPVGILKHTIPLLRGGAQIAIYSPTIEPLVHLSDVYSTSRRTAFVQAPPSSFTELETENERVKWQGDEDFPLNPTLLLNTNVQSARVKEWQVLPGRTHPIMTAKGGAEGYLFTATRVIPAEGRVEARGKFARKRGVEVKSEIQSEDGVEVKNENAARVEGESTSKRIKLEDGASLNGTNGAVANLEHATEESKTDIS
ncbi:Gcd10p-domain-containing protein [Mollisia scopiformis]|uniref:tRNA (adenine(58)-N(1))-methyltransferase non-catalytic subunit TRM6 n=1 Tax=Mollisia scopiformis TaxID=149040 RepID=A0A132B9P4_MOLSC|nr:Gcd10p-domain-containing protein [Mollisia scopiformis]KUJ08963.1 Gcd10p-domain-containing protein [Mollisia scopiformis]